ncbi:MAG: NAD(P)H-hydrate epimerase [Pyrinomonadaceae bacterium]
MLKVLTAAQMREVDRLTTERYGIPSIILMENAAHAVARVITEKLGSSVKGKSILILCGKGNNGGDGAALARMLSDAGAVVTVELFGKVVETNGDARVNFEKVQRKAKSLFSPKLKLSEVQPETEDNGVSDWMDNSDYDVVDMVVDALFGTGLNRKLEGFFDEQIGILNEWKRIYGTPQFVSVDVPSGLNSDIPNQDGKSIHADVTVTFTSPKPANVLPPASRSNGKLVVADIGSPRDLIDKQITQLYQAEKEDSALWLRATEFSKDSYKNKRGHTLLIAGSNDYSGAAVLAGNAAMRSGVGLVTVACPKEAKAEIASRLLPDVILKGIDSEVATQELISDADAIAVGCGLDANDVSIEKLVRDIVETRKVPVIVDAGALWFFNPPSDLLQKHAPSKGEQMQKPAREQGRNAQLPDTALTDVQASANEAGRMPAEIPNTDADKSVPAPLILTPHEGEFMRLLGTDDKDTIKDRVAAVRDFATNNNVILVLKGERVLIGEPGGKVVVNPTGNSGLGKAGNGDTLTGILAGFVAQAVKMEIDIFETVVAAVYIAGMAGDIAEKKFGKRVMTASDVRECLVEVFAKFECKGS